MAENIQGMSLLRRHLSPLVRLILVGALAVVAVGAIVAWPIVGKNAAEQERAQQVHADTALPGSKSSRFAY